MRYPIFFILILTLFPLASQPQAEQILICDLVSSQSSIGNLLDSLYSEHGYNVERIQHIPPSDSFPEVTIIWAGIPEYCFWYTLTDVDTGRIIKALTSGNYIWAMGQEPFFDARLYRWFGFDILTWDPLPLDTLYGVHWNFLAGYTWLYDERPMSTYAIGGYYEYWDVLFGGPDSPGERGCRAVVYPDSQYFYKTFVLNIDLSRIIESDTFATVEDFALKVMRDWFELWPVGVEEAEPEILPGKFYLSNYPNPFNTQTLIAYAVPEEQWVSLTVYNILGEKVRSLVEAQKPAGYYSAMWDGRNDAGEIVSSGIYLYRLRAGDQESIRRMSLLR